MVSMLLNPPRMYSMNFGEHGITQMSSFHSKLSLISGSPGEPAIVTKNQPFFNPRAQAGGIAGEKTNPRALYCIISKNWAFQKPNVWDLSFYKDANVVFV